MGLNPSFSQNSAGQSLRGCPMVVINYFLRVRVMKQDNLKTTRKVNEANILNLSESETKLVNWLRRKRECSLEEIVAEIIPDKANAKEILASLQTKSFLKRIEFKGEFLYQLQFPAQKNDRFIERFLKSIELKIGKITFAKLITLTFISAALLTPFVLSPIYLAILRDHNFDFHQFLKGDLYKQITGYTALFFILLEMILTVRKRGRGWWLEIKIPGSLILWRSLHILVGVGLLAIVAVHTIGATGLNFNAIFLWVFFGVTISALIGVVAETGVLESPRKYFGKDPQQPKGKSNFLPTVSKSQLIKTLRNLWLSSHIFLVNIFFVMLVFHIFLGYYYQ